MEQITQIKKEMLALEAQIREAYGRVVYSTKTHEKSADLCVRKLGRVKISQIVLSALTTGGLVTAIFGDSKASHIALIIATILSTALLALNAYMKEVDLGQQAEKHKKTASELWDVRESYLSILTDLHDGQSDIQESRSKRDKLQARLTAIYEAAPRTLPKAYKEAGIGLKKHEELTFSDEEIDAFLPSSLRRAKKTSSHNGGE
jgi:hypothetical protein